MFKVLHCVNMFLVIASHIDLGETNIKPFPEDTHLNHMYLKPHKQFQYLIMSMGLFHS